MTPHIVRALAVAFLFALISPAIASLSLPAGSIRSHAIGVVLAQEPAPEEGSTQEEEPAPDPERLPDPEHAFDPLDLPATDGSRATSGAPGETYWQQRADYVIRVTLDDGDHRIEGSETITYTNNSPDSLHSLWVQLDQNLFREDSYGAQRADEDQRHGGFFKDGGFDIQGVTIDLGGRAFAPEYRIDDTMMEVLLPEPLAPGGEQLQLDLEFSFTIPETGADRMGRLEVRRGTIYELAQWYPRMFTYDDVSGWNNLPYLGQGEWYLEYGDFDLELTVPRDYVVVATGELQNPEEVLTREQQDRLREARRSATTIPIIGEDEAGDGSTRPMGEGPLTWRFRAENVRDVAWAASDRFIWDAASWEDVLIMSAYPEESLGGQQFSGWERSTEYLRHSIKHYSEQWARYPYPVAINVGGLALGMEYPMIVFCSHQARGGFLFAVTDHEIGHTWFPMMVGSDERRYAWMDEGFNTFINYYSGMVFSGGAPILAALMQPGQIANDMRSAEHSMLTVPDSLDENEIGFLAYNKPAAVLVLLRESVLGPELFDEAFREYIRRWSFKHPQPADFIRTMEDVTGEDLDWFFRGWVYENGTLDQAVAGVQVVDDRTVVTIENRGRIVMPLELRLIFRDGTEEYRDVPVRDWSESGQFVLEISEKRLRHVQIDPDGVLPDVDRSNNVWGRGVVGRRSSG
jgi:hypothetical protein